jgi:hypothetical protein
MLSRQSTSFATFEIFPAFLSCVSWLPGTGTT